MKTFHSNAAQAQCGHILYNEKVEVLPSSTDLLNGCERLSSKYLEDFFKPSSETLWSRQQSMQRLIIRSVSGTVSSQSQMGHLYPFCVKAHRTSVKKGKWEHCRSWWMGGVLGRLYSGHDTATALINSQHMCLFAHDPHINQPKCRHGWGRLMQTHP